MGATSLLTAPAPTAVTSIPTDAVRIEILEGAPDELSWKFTAPPISEIYFDTAFGFATIPTKYSAKGIKIDRAMPFVFRASAMIELPGGNHRLLLRAKTGSRVFMDGKEILATRFPDLKADGHEEVPDVPMIAEPNLRYAQPGHIEDLKVIQLDGRPHEFTIEALVGVKGRRPELSELTLSIAEGNGPFRLLSPKLTVAYTDDNWAAFELERREFFTIGDQKRRREVASDETTYWQGRHELARRLAANASLGIPNPSVPGLKSSSSVQNDIDNFIGSRLEAAGVKPAPLTDDYAFLRRVTLDTIGTLPTPGQISELIGDRRSDRRARAIERLLANPGWADHWVSYWQDVLAENPGILKPMLNNTGPFRWWLHEAFSDNKSMDRFATELVMMEGSSYYGGPAGFGVATENDVPMAQKAQIVAQAFMGMQLQCARCHDAPYHDFKQKDLFSLAAMLRREPQQVPMSSSIPTNANIVVGRIVNVTLKPGSKVEPAWPFPKVTPEEFPDGVLRNTGDSRERLAALLTDPRNQRFARVLVNRVWKRYLGWGIVEPVDDWETAKPSDPQLLDHLARELVIHDYDLKHIARLILNSQTYQREVRPDGSMEGKPENRLFASPARRRLSAEQVVDSLFAAVGKPLNSEEMNIDVDARRPVKEFNNLGNPHHAWEFTSLSNERDRPALAMPKAQSVVDILTTFGWRESRQSPVTVRDTAPNVLQPASLANGLLANGRITRLSEDSAITQLAVDSKTVPELVNATFLRILSRPPSLKEKQMFIRHLDKDFDRRIISTTGTVSKNTALRAVSWSNHLNPEATRIKQELEREARAGDPPTTRLRPEWRERMEDVVWALVNSPEFVFAP